MELAAKIFGCVLLLAGVIIIGWALYSSYNVFTGKTAMPEIFNFPETIQTPTAKGKVTGTMGLEDVQGQVGQIIGEQLKGFLPVDTLPKILNLFSWSMLAGILIFGGSQISSLGIKLLKK